MCDSKKISLENILKEDIQNNLQLSFQPIYSLKENKIVKYEVLSTFISNKFENIPTLETIMLLERLNLIDFLDFLILDKIKEIIQKTDIKLCVNISPKTIINSNFVNKVLSIDKNLNNLELEIVEREKIDSLTLNFKISLLKKYGIQIIIDDFPIKNSNLENLLKYDVDGVKIDRSLLHKLKKKSSYEKIVSLLKDLNFEVTAEGIETEEEFEAVKNAGVDFIQGYYIGKPKKSF